MASDMKFDVPSGAAAQVQIIDTSTRIHGFPTKVLLTPDVEGFETFPALPVWCFPIQSSTGENLLFDLGMPADLTSFTPIVQKLWIAPPVRIETGKNVAEVLEEEGVALSDIKSIVWSHHHYDHIGDIRTFPTTTDLVVGPGFKDAFYPFYPTNPDSDLHESYFE